MSKYFPNKHRPQGGIGKSHAIARQAISDCYRRLGSVEGLYNWAMESDTNKYAFYTILLPKLIPAEIADQHGVSDTKIQVVILPAQTPPNAKPLEGNYVEQQGGVGLSVAGVAVREPEA